MKKTAWAGWGSEGGKIKNAQQVRGGGSAGNISNDRETLSTDPGLLF